MAHKGSWECYPCSNASVEPKNVLRGSTSPSNSLRLSKHWKGITELKSHAGASSLWNQSICPSLITELLILTVSGLSYDLTASTIPTNQLPQPQLCIALLLIIIIVSYSWHSLLCFPPANLFQEDLLPSVPLSLTKSLYMFNSQKNTIGCANCHHLWLSKLLWQAIS